MTKNKSLIFRYQKEECKMGDNNTVTASNKALKAGLWYTISSISVRAIGIITTPLYTRLLTTSDYGRVSTLTSWYSILSVFVAMALYYSIGRAKIDFPGKLESYVGSLQLFCGMVTALLALICFVFLQPVSQLLGMSETFTIVLIIYLIAEPAIILNQNKFKYQYKYKSNIAISLYTTIATLTFSFLLIFLSPDRGLGRALGIVVPAVLLSLGLWFYEIRHGYLKFNKEYIVYGLKISLPLIFHTISLSVLAQSDRLAISQFCGEDKTAIYSLAYQYAVLIDIVLNAVGQAWLPWFHDTYATGNLSLIREKIKPLIVLGGMLAVGAVSLAPEAIFILGPEEYQSGVWVVGPVVLGTYAKYIFQNYEHVELHLKKTWYISAATILAAVLNVFLNYIFIPRYGFIAAAYTTLFCYICLFVLHCLIVRLILKQNAYSDFYFYASFLVACLLCVGMMLLYNHTIIRLTLLAIIMVIYLTSNRNIIREFFNRKK